MPTPQLTWQGTQGFATRAAARAAQRTTALYVDATRPDLRWVIKNIAKVTARDGHTYWVGTHYSYRLTTRCPDCGDYAPANHDCHD